MFILSTFIYFLQLVVLNAQENPPFNAVYSSTFVSCSEGQNPIRKTFQEYINEGLCIQQCRNNRGRFFVAASSNPTSTVWTIVGGAIQSQTPNNCIVNWGIGTNASITVSSVINGVTINFPTLCVDLNNSPAAGFTVAPALSTIEFQPYKACIDQIINFTDLSSASAGTPINNRYWDFGDGTTSSEINPSHAYTTDGTYIAKSYLSNQCRCLAESSLTIVVQNKSVGIICPSVVCQGEKATYSIENPFNNTTCSNFNWSIVGGTIVTPLPYSDSIDVVWNPTNSGTVSNDGFGYVKFNPSACTIGCYSATTIKVPIIKSVDQPIVWEGALASSPENISPTATITICGTSQQKFKMPQWPSTEFVWEIINATNPTSNEAIVYTDQRNEIFLNPGTLTGAFKLKCTYYNTLLKCGGVAIRNINVTPSQSIDGPTSACLIQPENYTTSTGASLTWKYRLMPNGILTGTFVGSTFSPTFPSAGQYEIVAAAGNSCGNTTKLVTVVGVPALTDAQVIGGRVVCNGTPSVFSVANTVPNTVIGWEVTNGSILGSNYANAITANFNISNPEIYNLTVWRESTLAPYCRSASTVISLTPTLIDNAILGAISPCGSTTTTYTNATTGADNLEWSVVPASAGNIVGVNNANSVQVLWNQAVLGQTSFVRLKINKCNKTSVGNLQVAVSNPQLALTTPLLTFCSELSQPFTITSIAPLTAGTVTWNFGDNTGDIVTTNVFTINHIFNNTTTSNASYTVTASIVNPNGCIVTISKAIMVTVKPTPIADVTPAVSRCAATFNLINVADRILTLNIQNSNGVTIKWFKNGVIVAGATATSYTAATFGLYHAEVDNGVCTKITNKVSFSFCDFPPNPCTIVPDPNINSTISNSCGAITAGATYAGTAVSRQWIAVATNTIISTTNNMTATVTEPGSYLYLFKATFTATNGQFCTVAKLNTIIVPYLADLKTDTACPSTIAGQYTIKLSDFSKMFATTPITSWEFSVNNIVRPKNTTLGDLDTTRNITLAPGTYTLKLIVGRAGYASCTKIVTLVLPAFPTAVITAGGGTTCPENSMQFSTPTQTGCTYEWTFGVLGNQNLATNLQQNPRLTFAPNPSQALNYEIKLKVTNRVGCSATSTPKTVTVNQLDLRGKLPDNNIILCQGETASVLYENASNAQAVTSYQWMNNNVAVSAAAGGNLNPLVTTLPGTYWVRIGNTYGCKEEILNQFKCTVAFVSQNISIVGGPTFCLGKPVDLSAVIAGGSTSSGSNALYEWTRDDLGSTVIATTPQLNDVPAGVGTYTYRLTVYNPKGTGGYCTSTATKTITVVQEPTITSLYFDTLTCNPYSFTLHATANLPGTFAWSNGTTGADITTNFGGAYKVIFTSNSGCTATAQIETPRSPESYLWEFPSGCYKYCNKFDFQRSFIGPALAVFPAGWTWNASTAAPATPAPTVTGFNAMTPYAITDDTGNYTYSMTLNASDDCSYTSKPATINFENCAGCSLHTFTANATNPLLVQPTAATPYLYYQLKFNFTAGAKVIHLSNLNNDGFFIPATINVPASGLTNYSVKFVPSTIPYLGPIKMALSLYEQRFICGSDQIVYISGGPVNRNSNFYDDGKSLNLYPNPAKNSVTIAYEFTDSEVLKTISIYDITGRLLQQKIATVAKETWEVALDGLLAGSYIVVMKENDQVVLQKNLIKTD